MLLNACINWESIKSWDKGYIVFSCSLHAFFQKYFQALWLQMQRKCCENVNNETAKGMVQRNSYNNLNG